MLRDEPGGLAVAREGQLVLIPSRVELGGQAPVRQVRQAEAEREERHGEREEPRAAYHGAAGGNAELLSDPVDLSGLFMEEA